MFNQGFYTSVPLMEDNIYDYQRLINGGICYKLRCAYLHSGNLELNQRYNDKFPDFSLIITHSNDQGIYVEKNNDGEELAIDIRHLTKVMCNEAKEYYNNHANKDEFKTKHIDIVDVSKEAEKAKKFLNYRNDVLSGKRNIEDYNELTHGAKDLLEKIKNGSFIKEEWNEEEEILIMSQFSELLFGGFLNE